MSNEKFHPWLHRMAVSTVCVALITLTFGALVTTKRAGMAFTDWPTSDGYLMVTYPWLRDFSRNWNKFLEHGHRLAGMLIGMWSIALVLLTFRIEHRRWVKILSLSILAGVICQGLLGGFRVQLNARGLAMLHGIFAAIVFSLMGAMSAVTSRGWQFTDEVKAFRKSGVVRISAMTLTGLICLQYVLGSFIRHQGTALNEHFWLGLGVLAVGAFTALAAMLSGVRWLIRSGALVLLAVSGQVALGLISWGLKYGVVALGYVAVADSALQITMRTAHMVWGVITLMTVIVHLVKVCRTIAESPKVAEPVIELRRVSSVMVNGGAQ